jgi:hypothetical protein
MLLNFPEVLAVTDRALYTVTSRPQNPAFFLSPCFLFGLKTALFSVPTLLPAGTRAQRRSKARSGTGATRSFLLYRKKRAWRGATF